MAARGTARASAGRRGRGAACGPISRAAQWRRAVACRPACCKLIRQSGGRRGSSIRRVCSTPAAARRASGCAHGLCFRSRRPSFAPFHARLPPLRPAPLRPAPRQFPPTPRPRQRLSPVLSPRTAFADRDIARSAAVDGMACTAFAAPAGLALRRAPGGYSARRGMRTGPVALAAGGNGDAGLGRLNEWASSDGDRGVQDVLASELLRATRHANSARVMDERIADGMAGVTELLAEMYLRTERELQEQHADLARRESLPHVSKWNRALIDSHKESTRARDQISAELAEVRYLLKRAKRSRPTASGTTGTSGRDRRGIHSAVFTVGVTAFVLGSFENVAARENGPVHLAQFGSVSLLLVLLGAHLHAVRALERGDDDART